MADFIVRVGIGLWAGAARYGQPTNQTAKKSKMSCTVIALSAFMSERESCENHAARKSKMSETSAAPLALKSVAQRVRMVRER